MGSGASAQTSECPEHQNSAILDSSGIIEYHHSSSPPPPPFNQNSTHPMNRLPVLHPAPREGTGMVESIRNLVVVEPEYDLMHSADYQMRVLPCLDPGGSDAAIQQRRAIELGVADEASDIRDLVWEDVQQRLRRLSSRSPSPASSSSSSSPSHKKWKEELGKVGPDGRRKNPFSDLLDGLGSSGEDEEKRVKEEQRRQKEASLIRRNRGGGREPGHPTIVEKAEVDDNSVKSDLGEGDDSTFVSEKHAKAEEPTKDATSCGKKKLKYEDEESVESWASDHDEVLKGGASRLDSAELRRKGDIGEKAQPHSGLIMNPLPQWHSAPPNQELKQMLVVDDGDRQLASSYKGVDPHRLSLLASTAPPQPSTLAECSKLDCNNNSGSNTVTMSAMGWLDMLQHPSLPDPQRTAAADGSRGLPQFDGGANVVVSGSAVLPQFPIVGPSTTSAPSGLSIESQRPMISLKTIELRESQKAT